MSLLKNIWAPSSEFVSSSIPSWQISTAHAQPFRGARDLVLCLKVPLDSLLLWASSGGSGETARMRRLAWTFAARIGDKYQIRLARPICSCKVSIVVKGLLQIFIELFVKKIGLSNHGNHWDETGITGVQDLFNLFKNCICDHDKIVLNMLWKCFLSVIFKSENYFFASIDILWLTYAVVGQT